MELGGVALRVRAGIIPLRTYFFDRMNRMDKMSYNPPGFILSILFILSKEAELPRHLSEPSLPHFL